MTAALPSSVISHQALQNYTTFKVGGPARYFAAPHSLEEIQEVLHWWAPQDIPLFILGRGSNLVVADAGFPGLVLHLGKNYSRIQICENHIRAQAGAWLSTVVTQAVRAGLAGIECLAGVPGTMGGGARMNAGAYGQEFSQVVSAVGSLTRKPPGEICVRSNAECDFSYRHSLFCREQEIITEVDFLLQPGDADTLRSTMEETLRKRKAQQPLELPNAGSMFKRPPNSYAGMLIEQSGLKGFQIGGAAVSEKHANFVVNRGGATARDIWTLTQAIIAKVEQDHGIVLEREVEFLGDFS